MTQQDNNDFAELAKQQADKVMGKIPLLGAVSWLMMQQNATRHTLLSELEWRVMPPLMLEQAKLYMREKAPLAYVSWAYLSEDAAKRYQQAPHHLMPSDWKSGDQVWIVDLCTPFGGAQDVLKDLREGVLRGQEIHQFTLGAGRELEVLTLPAVNTPQV
jgi:cytolysin-activating lysine-acyltransferase